MIARLLLIILEQQKTQIVSQKIIEYSYNYLALAVSVVSRLGYAIFLMPISPLIIFSAVAHSYSIHTPLVHLEKVHLLIAKLGPPTAFFAVSFTTIIRLGLALKAATECAHDASLIYYITIVKNIE